MDSTDVKCINSLGRTRQTDNRRLRLPKSLRALPAPWASKRFSELDSQLQRKFRDTLIDVHVIERIGQPDEVRDLFIRLQSGTALSRQQIRDAWPGKIGPYVERLADKLHRRPSIHLFQLVDKRGARSEEDKDRYDADRQFCAQLLTLVLAREYDPCAIQSVGANDLDKLYYGFTEFDPTGLGAQKFEKTLRHTTKGLQGALECAKGTGQRTRRKFRKLDIISVFLFIQDVSKNEHFKFIASSYRTLAKHLLRERLQRNSGRSTSGAAIVAYSQEWRRGLVPGVGVKLDPKRGFDPDQ